MVNLRGRAHSPQRHRYCAASTSTNLYTYDEVNEYGEGEGDNHDGEGVSDEEEMGKQSIHPTECMHSRQSSLRKGLDTDYVKSPNTKSENGKQRHIRTSPSSSNSVAEEEEPFSSEIGDCHAGLEDTADEDQLDMLLRVTSNLLRISKSILSSSKRMSVINGVVAQVRSSYL